MAAIAEEWVKRLLYETPSTEAVFAIAQFWSHRLDSQDDRFGLSLPEYHIQLVLIYTGEVGNGGHSQYFDNRGLGKLSDTTDALHAVGLQPLADVLRQAATVDSGELDREAWALMSDIDEALIAYARAHDQEILAQERL